MSAPAAEVRARAGEPAEKAAPGVHEAAFAALQRFSPPPARVLDLGAGAGAWAKRLSSAGYAVTAVDRNPDDWAFESIPCFVRDLNQEFAAGLEPGFDAVTGLEVIEHLENPSLFLRECRKLIRPDGIVVLTTPNIENVAGRLRFLFTGRIRGFDRDPRWNDPTHITPMQSDLFEKLCPAAGLQIAWHGFNRPTEATSGALKRLVLGALRPLLKGVTGGDNHIFVLKRLG